MMKVLLAALCLSEATKAFIFPLSTSHLSTASRSNYRFGVTSFILERIIVERYAAGSDEIEEDDNDDEEAEPGTMRVSEIKAELKLRGVNFSDCFDKESLAARLREARATGKADPNIIDNFNRNKLEDNVEGQRLDVSDEDLQKAVGGDGTLPGGMPPDMLKKLMANPELMVLLQSPKMQEAMRLMMTGGQDALEKAMEEDREVYEVVMKLNKVMADAQ